MFKKILIANRGEIACRVIKTARRMGIKTVAVYSEADRDALHVAMADEAVLVGPAPAAQSYLVIENIVNACKETGAEAVHPGYGFLSERAAFAEALADAGIAFIGPPVGAIEAMGDKIESKKMAAKAGVSTVPGYMGIIDTPEEAVKIANDIGYPVMIKASAGGGGKGMRIAESEAEVAEGFARAKSEAASSFGDDRVFIEKFVTQPRHIEIQVLADKKGNVIYLGERECSIQRRNQKVIEEAPSPFLDEATRKAMGEQSVALAKAVDYVSAGTVEFIVDGARNFYFLEMNTRLQVEHPVTELITGIDLVEQMIKAAAGEPLDYTQDDIKLTGWAIESRIYAEDPYRGFLPSIGRLTTCEPPVEDVRDGITVRNDTGVVEGSEISMFYDPMISKLVTHAKDRETAIDAMADALDCFGLDGIRHNIPFLSALMAHPRWRSGALTTGFIAEEFPDGFNGVEPSEDQLAVLASVALAIDIKRRERLDHLPGRLRPHTGQFRRAYIAKIGEARVPVEIDSGTPAGDLDLGLTVGEAATPVTLVSSWNHGEALWTGVVNGESVSVQVRKVPGGVTLSWRGIELPAAVMRPEIDAMDQRLPEKERADTSKIVLCPMPGLVVSLAVKEGDEVDAGQQLAVIEAMKMENILRAERAGVIKAIKAAPGDSLAVDAVIMEFQ